MYRQGRRTRHDKTENDLKKALAITSIIETDTWSLNHRNDGLSSDDMLFAVEFNPAPTNSFMNDENAIQSPLVRLAPRFITMPERCLLLLKNR